LSKLLDSIANNSAVSRLAVQLYSRPRWRQLFGILADNRRELTRFVKFATVGVVGTVVDFSILNVLILLFDFSKFWANTCSFTAAVVSNFVWNRLWTFPESRERKLVPQLVQFALVSLGGYAINQTIFLGLDSLYLHVWGTLGYNISKAIAILVVLFWNFGVNRVWTYRGIE
jgi:putative flippase GtrA